MSRLHVVHEVGFLQFDSKNKNTTITTTTTYYYYYYYYYQ